MAHLIKAGVGCVLAAILINGCAVEPAEMAAGDQQSGALAMAMDPSMSTEPLITELGTATKVAAVSGPYAAGSTWKGGVAPGPNDVALIPAGLTVTVGDTTAVAKSLVVRGALKFATTVTTKLRVETLVIAENASLSVGDETGGVRAGVTATIAIRDDLPVTQDSQRLARGIVVGQMATVRMISAQPRTPYVTLSGDALHGSTGSLATTAAVPADWQKNDQIVIPATEFTREWEPDMPAGTTDSTITSSRLKNELRTIAAISQVGTPGITLNAKLAFDHTRADATNANIHVHAANLTRNIIVTSENTSTDVSRNGHALFMTNDVKLTGVLFKTMGRTQKREVASDPSLPTSVYNVPGVNGAPAGNQFSNPRGRYAVHFHEAGPDDGTTAQVTNCAVWGTPGWGFVNHSSHVDFVDNVAFDFKGAGFVAEDGEETGLYSGNIAIGGTGNGEFSDLRTVFGNAPRMDQGDMGFTGDGFWLQSPDVVVTNNIAAGCKGSGFFYWAGGRFETTSGHYTGRPLTRPLPTGVAPRKWDYDGDGKPDAYVIEDFPLQGFSGNVAYGSFTGLRLRFVNHSNTNIFDIRGKDLGHEIIPADGQTNTTDATRASFQVTNSTFWNNLIGIHGSYLTHADFSNITIVAAKPALTAPMASDASTVQYSAEAGEGAIGINFHHQNLNNTLTKVTVKNYTTGLWRDGANVGAGGITFLGCAENTYNDSATSPEGSQFFFINSSTDNVPDNPQ